MDHKSFDRRTWRSPGRVAPHENLSHAPVVLRFVSQVHVVSLCVCDSCVCGCVVVAAAQSLLLHQHHQSLSAAAAAAGDVPRLPQEARWDYPERRRMSGPSGRGRAIQRQTRDVRSSSNSNRAEDSTVEDVGDCCPLVAEEGGFMGTAGVWLHQSNLFS